MLADSVPGKAQVRSPHESQCCSMTRHNKVMGRGVRCGGAIYIFISKLNITKLEKMNFERIVRKQYIDLYK